MVLAAASTVGMVCAVMAGLPALLPARCRSRAQSALPTRGVREPLVQPQGEDDKSAGSLVLRMARIGEQLAELRTMLNANIRHHGLQQERAGAEIEGLRVRLLDGLTPDTLRRSRRLARLSQRLDQLERCVGHEQAECLGMLEALLAAVERRSTTLADVAVCETSAVHSAPAATAPRAVRHVVGAVPSLAAHMAPSVPPSALVQMSTDTAPAPLSLLDLQEQSSIMLQSIKEMLRMSQGATAAALNAVSPGHCTSADSTTGNESPCPARPLTGEEAVAHCEAATAPPCTPVGCATPVASAHVDEGITAMMDSQRLCGQL